MSILTFTYTFTAGTTAQSSQVNANFTSVATVVNGNLDNSNLSASAGIVATKLNLTSEFMNLRTTNNRGFSGGVTGDTVPRIALNSRGTLDFGAGSASAMDISLKRESATILAVRDLADSAYSAFKCSALTLSSTLTMAAEGTSLQSTNNRCFSAGVTGDTVPRVTLNSRGSVDFGPGSASATDMALTREDANTLAVRNVADNAYKNLKCAVITPSTVIAPTVGGTGLGTYTTGDFLYASATDTLSKLGIGSNGQFLSIVAGLPAWANGSSTAGTQNGRLTLTSALAVTVADVLTATSVYFTPFRGHQIALYNGSSWDMCTFAEITISLSGLTSALPYDIFIYDSNADLVADAGEAVAWTNTTTRATAIAYQNGIPCKTGALARRYVGTVLMSATGQSEDSTKHRGVWNCNNRVLRHLYARDTTDSWTYNSSTFRPFNNSTTLGVGKVSWVTGLAEDLVRFQALGQVLGTEGVSSAVGVGIDSTSASSAILCGPLSTYVFAGYNQSIQAFYSGYVAVGSHSAYPLEQAASSTSTFYGDNGGSVMSTGLLGEVWA